MTASAVKAGVSAVGAMTEVLHADSAQEFRRWDELALSAPEPDAYYRPGYVAAYEPLENSCAVALVIRVQEQKYLVPLLVRPIVDAGGARIATDALTPYGYGGLLALDAKRPNPKAMLEAIIAAVRAWCMSQRLVACVIRLHPLAQQAELVRQAIAGNASAWLSTATETTAIDLANWDKQSDLLRGMSGDRRRNLARARKSFTATWHAGEDATAIDAFRELYGPKMHELGAREFFSFPPEYYRRMAKGLGENFLIVIARASEQPVGAAIFLRGNNWAHYHLSATNAAGAKRGAATLAIHEGARWAARAGCRRLHLGGGMQKGDSLMAFKASFGGAIFSYSALTVVADQAAYERLSEAKAAWPYGLVARGQRKARVPAKVLSEA